MNVNNQSKKNSFLSNHLKNTSESSISYQNQQKSAHPINNKNQQNNIFLDNYNSKTRPKLLNDILSPNFINDPKITNKAPFSVERDNRKLVINNPANPSNSIFNKLSFDNAISKKALSSLVPQQQQEKYNSVNNTFKISFNEKNEKNEKIEKNSNAILNNNSNNNLSNLHNINNNNLINNKNNSIPLAKNSNIEKVSLAPAKPESLIINKATNANSKNIPGLIFKENQIAQFNNINNLNNTNNLNANLNLGFNNIANNLDLISNNNNTNFNSAATMGSPIIPMLPPQQINVNINNYNINNFNIQSAIPLKSTKKFFKFENINSSNNKNLKNLENQFSPKHFSNMNNNVISFNNLNPIIHSGSSNNQIINNENITDLINFENKDYLTAAGGKKNLMNANNPRFIINKFFEDAQSKFSAEGYSKNNLNYKSNEKLNFDLMLSKEREKCLPANNNNFKNKDTGNNKEVNNKNSLKHQNSKSSKAAKQEEFDKNMNNFKENFENNKATINFNQSENFNDCFDNANAIKNILNKEIIFDSAKNLESVN